MRPPLKAGSLGITSASAHAFWSCWRPRDPVCDHALASFMEVLDTTIANVALPYILQPW